MFQLINGRSCPLEYRHNWWESRNLKIFWIGNHGYLRNWAAARSRARPFRIILPFWGISRARHTMLSTKAPRRLGRLRRGNHGKSLDRGHSRGMQLTFVESVYQQKRTYSPQLFSSLFSGYLFLSLFSLDLTRFSSSFLVIVTAKLSLLPGSSNYRFTLADRV